MRKQASLPNFFTSESNQNDNDEECIEECSYAEQKPQQSQRQNWRVLPWRDAAEFIEVAQIVELAPLEAERQALIDVCQRLGVWLARLEQHQLPRAVLATGELADALLLGERQALANASQRFVSLLAGEEEARTRQMGFTVPVTRVAAGMGIPDWLVQIRHDVCHGLLPPAPLLAEACREALLWLRNQFWRPQAKRLSASSSTSSASNGAGADRQPANPPLSIRRFIRLQLSPRSAENSAALNGHLDGVKARRLSASQSENRRWIRSLLSAMTAATGEDARGDAGESVASGLDNLVAFWLPMLGVLKKCNLICALMEETLLATADDANASESMLTWSLGWLTGLERVVFPDGSRRPPLAYCLRRDCRSGIDWPRLLRSYCVANLRPRLAPLARLIVRLHYPALQESVAVGLLSVLDETESAAAAASNDAPTSSDATSRSCSRKRKLKDASADRHVDSSAGDALWQRDLTVDWDSLPIGCSPR